MVIIFTVIILLAGALLLYKIHKPQVIFTYKQNDCTLRIEAGKAVFPFGETKAKARLYQAQKKIAETEMILYNDGKDADEDNFLVSWYADKVVITVKGEEMEDTDYILPFSQ